MANRNLGGGAPPGGADAIVRPEPAARASAGSSRCPAPAA